MQKTAPKRVDVLLLSDGKFRDYQRYKAEQERELHSQQSPSSIDTRPISLQDDISQRAEQLLATESANHFTRVLTSVGLKEVRDKARDKLQPIDNELPRFRDLTHFRSTMQRLHSRASSMTTLPVTPLPDARQSPVCEKTARKESDRHFEELRRDAEQRATADCEKLREYLGRARPETERPLTASRPMSTQPYSRLETQASSATPKVHLTKRVLKHYFNEVASAVPFETDRSTKATDRKKAITLRRRRTSRKATTAATSPKSVSSEDSSASASFLRGPNIYRHIEREKAVNWRENEAQRQQQYWKRVLKEIKSQYARKQRHARTESVGQLMEIMFRKKPEINEDEAKHGDIAKFRTLNEKLYKMMKEDPAELHRITTQPEFMVPAT